jgi:hypothetical protein
MVMRVQKSIGVSFAFVRGRTGGPTLCVGGAEPRAERR